MNPKRFCRTLVLASLLATGATQAQTPDPADKPHSWQAAAPRLTAEAYFTNLKDGDRIETPFLLKFGLSGADIAATRTAIQRNLLWAGLLALLF